MKGKLKYILLFLVLALSFAGFSQALSPPAVGCIQVGLSGNPTLSWTAPADPSSDFVAYHIYTAPASGGAFTEVTSIGSIGTNTFTHNITTPQSASQCYYIITESSDGINTYFSVPSDTLCSISLTVLPSVSPLGYANIEWTSPYPNGAPSGNPYEVTMQYPPGASEWATHTFPYGTNSWDYEVDVCDAFLNFQVAVLSPSGCYNQSDTEGDNFTDQTPPAIPEVTSVSIDHITNDAVITWLPSSSPDTQGYILYSCNGSTVIAIDSILGANSTQFVDLLASTTGPTCYLLAAYDTCYSGVPPSPNTSPTGDICNCSIFLDPIPYGVCENFVHMTWSAFTGWVSGVDHYNIYHSYGGLPFDLAGTVSGDINEFSHDFSFIESGIHSYYIEAVSVSNGYTAESNLQEVNIVYPVAPAYDYLSSASVTGAAEITVTLQTDPVATEHDYRLQRFRSFNNTWEDIIEWNNLGQPSLEFVDTDVTPSAFSYTYRVIVKNLCDVFVDTSNIGKTIVLSGVSNQTRLVNALQWSHYEGWENGVSAYRIHRKIGADGADEVIGEVNSSINYYEDDASDLLYTEGNFCYRIEAVENPSTLFPTTSFNAFSNEVCLVLEPKIWVPNAFVVDGFNSTFKPVISFADFSSYQMFIYSRWGDVIYQTNDINAPWNGRMNGELVQEGAYPYFISVEDGNGRPYEAAGLVIMLSARDQ